MSKYLIKCGKLFNGVDEKYYENYSVLVENQTILEVGAEIALSDDVEVIDLSNKVVTPGLSDIHTHYTAYHNENVLNILSEHLTKTSAYRTMGAVANLQELLNGGFTLIRECASLEKDWILRDVRDAINEGMVDGPNFIVCGHSGGTTGGHVDFRQYVKNPITQEHIFKSPSVGSGPVFFKEWVRGEFLQGVNYIKMHIDGGFATPNDDPEHRHLTEDEIRVIIETAHDCRLKVTAHIYGDESARLAIKYGVDGIEHGALLKPETYDLIAENNIYIVPTMCFFNRGVFLDEKELAHVPAYMAKKYREKHEKLCLSREALVKHIENDSILVGYGTDLGCVEPMKEAYLEYETMIRSGVSPFKALKIATSNSAKIVEREDLGAILPGKKADITAWSEDPTIVPTAFRDCKFVMKHGKVIKNQ